MKPAGLKLLKKFAAELNERQKAYLFAAYDEEMRLGQNEWMDYGYVGGWKIDTAATPNLRRALTATKYVDKGTGSTWAALSLRWLVTTRRLDTGFRDARTLKPIYMLQIKMTGDGRRLVRLMRGEPLTRPRLRTAKSAVKPLSLMALRILAHGQEFPDQTISASDVWEDWIPPHFQLLGVAKGLVKRGLFTGDDPYALRITDAGKAIDVTKEENWKPLRQAIAV